jgi:hypothetical protein
MTTLPCIGNKQDLGSNAHLDGNGVQSFGGKDWIRSNIHDVCHPADVKLRAAMPNRTAQAGHTYLLFELIVPPRWI